jgi:tRNA(fMet)-specific endonuclease VapC
VAEAHAALLVSVREQGRPRGAHDLIIAATARTFDRTVVSADGRSFVDLPGVEVRSHR